MMTTKLTCYVLLINRVLFFNGKSKCWGYEAPRDEIRKEIEKAMKEIEGSIKSD